MVAPGQALDELGVRDLEPEALGARRPRRGTQDVSLANDTFCATVGPSAWRFGSTRSIYWSLR